MFDRRLNNIEIFKDTERQCNTNALLKSAIIQSNNKQYIVCESDKLDTDEKHKYVEPAKIIVSKKRSLEAAGAYKEMKVCVHNFASATNPGGGVTSGSNAQEEAICRCSTLYFNINDKEISEGFHYRHRKMLMSGKMDVTYNDDCIFTTGVFVFKADTSSPKTMLEKDWYQVDVITCAAPNLREHPSNAMNPNGGRSKAVKLSEKDLFDLHVKKMKRILDIAKKENEEVVILGAFGCGAFSNSPIVVAESMAQVIKEYQYDFKVIEFAVYCSPQNTENYYVFKRILNGTSK